MFLTSPLYFCVGCRQVHKDFDYKEEEGDLLITDWDKFLKSVEETKKKFPPTSSKQKGNNDGK